MSELPQCPKCQAGFTYQDGSLLICPSCGHEWMPGQASLEEEVTLKVRDAHGNLLQDGDAVTLIKDLRIKGSSDSIKIGTKVSDIRIVDASDGHNIDCFIKGFGAMKLKSEFVKKVT